MVWFAGCDPIPSSELSAVAKGGKVIFTSRAMYGKMYVILNKHSVSLGKKSGIPYGLGYLIQLESHVKRYKNDYDEQKERYLNARIKYMKDKNDDNEEDYFFYLDWFVRDEKEYKIQKERAKEIKKNYRWHADGYYYQKKS